MAGRMRIEIIRVLAMTVTMFCVLRWPLMMLAHAASSSLSVQMKGARS